MVPGLAKKMVPQKKWYQVLQLSIFPASFASLQNRTLYSCEFVTAFLKISKMVSSRIIYPVNLYLNPFKN